MNNLPTRKFSINLRAENIDLEKAIQHCLDSSVQQYLYLNKVAEIFIHKSKGGFEDHVDITQHFIKQPDYTLDNLPKNGWYVELPFDQNKIDLDKLKNAFNKKFQFYYARGSKMHKYYYIDQQGDRSCTDDLEEVGHLENVTHLFLKQTEKQRDLGTINMKIDMPEVKEIAKPEIIEIDGKKYRKIDTQGSFQISDMVLVHDNIIANVIGYDNEVLVVKINGEYKTYATDIFKLEEIKTKTWHYAICKNENGVYLSGVYSTEDKAIRSNYNALEYRYFEEQL